MQVEYNEMMESIVDGLVRHNEKELVGKMLLNGTLNMYDLQDQAEIQKRVRRHVELTAYQVLVALKKRWGADVQIMEEGHEVLTQEVE